MGQYREEPTSSLVMRRSGKRGVYSLLCVRYRCAEAWLFMVEERGAHSFALYEGDRNAAVALFHSVAEGEVASEHLFDVLHDARAMAEIF